MIERELNTFGGNTFLFKVRTGIIIYVYVATPQRNDHRQERTVVEWCRENMPCARKTRWKVTAQPVLHPKRGYTTHLESYGFFQTFDDALTFSMMWYNLPQSLTD